MAAVERGGVEDLVSCTTGGRLRESWAELASLPRAAVVVDEPYAKVFAPVRIAHGPAGLPIASPSVPIVFCDTRNWSASGSAVAYGPEE